MRNLIITAGYGYKSEQLRPFLLSAARYAPDASVIVFSDNRDPVYVNEIRVLNPNAEVIVPAESKLRKRMWRHPGKLWGVYRSKKTRPILKRILNPSNKGPFGKFSTAFLQIVLARFIWINDFLEEYPEETGLILIADSRDVFFQADPFNGFQESFLCGEEPVKISECLHNSAWVNRVYADKLSGQLGEMPVLCAGVTIGKTDEIISYVKAMVSDISNNMGKVIGIGGVDQGIHNKILHGDRILPFATSKNGDELLATLHYSDLSEFIFDESVGLKTKDGKLVKIVHQYDRHKILSDWVEKKYS